MDIARSQLLRESWKRLEPHGPAVAEAFYHRLFRLDPRLQDLFAITSMPSQHEKFLLMMREMVRSADSPREITALLAESGRRHRNYGVVSRDYLPVGEAFLWALQYALPGGLTPAEREVWAEAYTSMASIMGSADRD